LLSDVFNHGTAYRGRLAGFTLRAAGKTGTTND
jgi:membrane carboxypeptidase/penicillin-binding protein